MSGSRDPTHFRRLYQANPDPWGFCDDPYEQAKYRHSVEVLARQTTGRFHAGLEIGCSIGVLTRMLAPLCESLLAVDIVTEPLLAASERCQDQPWVRFQEMHVPGAWPDGCFDLIVLSEVLYFLSPDDIGRLADRVRGSLLPGATVLLVNWLGQSDDPMTGDQAAERFITATAESLTVMEQARRSRYRLDLLAWR